MAVAFDAASESASFTQASTDPQTFTHTPVGTPRGVLVFAVSRAGFPGDPFTGITYGGVSMTAVTGGLASENGAIDGLCKTYFLGSSIPTGAQTVSIDHDTGVTSTRWVSCITVTAAADTAISGTPVLIQSSSIDPTEQNVDTGATTALRFAGGFSSANSLATIPVGANSTAVNDIDFGTEMGVTCRETTGGSGSRPVGFEGSAAEETAFVHLAIAESGGGGGAVTRSFAVVVG